MVWKPKEKELSQEEAVALAKNDLKPYWHSSPPLFIAIQTDNGTHNIYPLNDEFEKKDWVILVLDLMSYNGENALSQLIEQQRRYAALGINFLAVLTAPYEFLKKRSLLEILLQQLHLPYICVLDSDNAIKSALQIQEFPDYILLTQGKILERSAGVNAAYHFEKMIQKFVRTNEHGLPLLPLYQTETPPLLDTGSYEFPRDAEHANIVLKGRWKKEKEWIETDDSDAQIQFKAMTPFVALVAGPAKELLELESARIAIEINEAPIIDLFSGKNIEFDEEGRTVVRCLHPGFFHILKDLTVDLKTIHLFFPIAKRIPVRIYSIKFSEPQKIENSGEPASGSS